MIGPPLYAMGTIAMVAAIVTNSWWWCGLGAFLMVMGVACVLVYVARTIGG